MYINTCVTKIMMTPLDPVKGQQGGGGLKWKIETISKILIFGKKYF